MSKQNYFTVLAMLILAIAIPAQAQDVGAPGLDSYQISGMPDKGEKSYIVVMSDDPLITYDGEIRGLNATKPRAGQRLDVDTTDARNYTRYLKDQHEIALQNCRAASGRNAIAASGVVHHYTNALNGFSAILTAEEAAGMAKEKGVLRVLPDTLRQKQTDSSPAFLGLTKGGEAWESGLTGEGIVVGVIDSGIWPEHPSFADDGSYSPPPTPPLDTSVFAACDFGNTGHNPDDAPFTCNNKLIGARQIIPTYRLLIGADPDEFDSARDDDGHGTHTASTAAGNAGVEAQMYGLPLGNVSGIAHRAHIIAYKGLGNLGGFTSDLAAAIDQAVFDGVDVINYSVGGGPGLTGADEIAFLFAADAGVFAATSAGNSGPGPGTIGGPASVPWITSVGASTQDRFFEGEVKFGKSAKSDKSGKSGKSAKSGKITGASVTPGTDGTLELVDAEFAGGDLCIPGTLDPTVAGKIVLCRRGAIARAGKSLAVYQAGGAGMILYNNSNDDNLFTDSHWVPSVHVDLDEGLEVKAYIAESSNPMAEIKTGKTTKWKNAPTMTIFSSRGPNTVAEDIIKPDITAPGMQILAGQSPFPDPGSTPPGELFQAIAGTSMSSPHVAGIFALLKQAHPDWSPAAAKSAIMTSAHQKVLDNDRETDAGPFAMGAGHVDPGKVDKKGSAFDPGLVYDAGLFEYAAFTCGADLGVFSPGSCAFLDGLGIPSDASDLNLPSIGIAELAGSQTVVRTVTSVAEKKVKFKAKVESPPGYDVTVTPDELKLDPGEVATYEVTIVNNGGGPIGEWRNGSLTWKGSGYEVFSPIAVNGALFDAPPAIAGAGTPGAASFDVKFGYDGAYTAAPHGLVANAPTMGDISQDPDQTYPSGDDGAGVDKIPFVVSGAAFLRWSLVIPGPDDIDLFLEDSGGNIIASSTNGGTDELIELVLPADGTYTMVVHGWSVPNEPLPYSLNFWEVPAVPGGGSLSVDSAPASATLGSTGTVDVSWTGLAAGVEHLGAVSHSDAGGIIGLTLVEVTTP